MVKGVKAPKEEHPDGPPPKKPRASSSKAAKDQPSEGQPANRDASQDMKDGRNMNTQLAAANGEGSEGKHALLNYYRRLSRFSDEKKIILDKWKKDKTCKWWFTYEKEKGSIDTSTNNSLEGYGTRCFFLYSHLSKC